MKWHAWVHCSHCRNCTTHAVHTLLNRRLGVPAGAPLILLRTELHGRKYYFYYSYLWWRCVDLGQEWHVDVMVEVPDLGQERHVDVVGVRRSACLTVGGGCRSPPSDGSSQWSFARSLDNDSPHSGQQPSLHSLPSAVPPAPIRRPLPLKPGSHLPFLLLPHQSKPLLPSPVPPKFHLLSLLLILFLFLTLYWSKVSFTPFYFTLSSPSWPQFFSVSCCFFFCYHSQSSWFILIIYSYTKLNFSKLISYMLAATSKLQFNSGSCYYINTY